MKKFTSSILLTTLIICNNTFCQTYTLPKLKYNYNALEPFIDSTTMMIHHSKHHQAYITNLNKAISGTSVDSLKIGLNELLLNISHYSEVIKNNAGGHYNHTLFWEILTPKKDTKPSKELLTAIETNFGTIDSLKKVMNQAASSRFGSGWAWLIVKPDLKLAVCSTLNQENPLMDISKNKGIPIIGIDVWEHAYYLKYQNKRGDYLNAIWNVIDWEEISIKYTKALKDDILKSLIQN